jgi:hypothetical protein
MLRNAVRLCLVLFVLAMSSAAFAQKTTVLRVVVVKTDNVAAYVQEIEKGKEILKKAGVQTQIRVWQARFAGPEAGAVVVGIESSSLAAFAAENAKISASSEYQAWLKGLDKLRTIVSDSLYSEL